MPSSSEIKPKKTVIAINGFLGRTSDWNFIRELLPTGWELHAIDLWNEENIADFDPWAQQMCDEIERAYSANDTKILLGYSMGGRLAMHLLAKSPLLFSGAVIISANPGLLTDTERLMREEADEIWAKKFLKDPWPRLMQEWEAQTTLRPPKVSDQDAVHLDRKESEFDRSLIARVLRAWTLGRQRNLRPEIAQIALPIEFITGEDDVKFTSLARDMLKEQAKGLRMHVIVAKAGHRVPWDAPTQFRAILAKFLSRW